MEARFTGTVVRATKLVTFCTTARSSLPYPGPAAAAGLRSTNPVVVGDEVTAREGPKGRYVICGIFAPHYVIRRASDLSKRSHIIAASVDQALLMATLRSPETATGSLDPAFWVTPLRKPI